VFPGGTEMEPASRVKVAHSSSDFRNALAPLPHPHSWNRFVPLLQWFQEVKRRKSEVRWFQLGEEDVITQGAIIEHGLLLELDLSTPAGKPAIFTLSVPTGEATGEATGDSASDDGEQSAPSCLLDVV